MYDSPTGNDTAVGIPYIDGRSTNSSGLVTKVSFYANNACIDNQIYFGAFEALTPLSSSTEFQLITQSGTISVNRSSSPSSMERVDISLCVLQNIPVGCQAKAFFIGQGQYFGSFASQCKFAYFPLGSTGYPRTYYKFSYNPFISDNTPAIYVDDYNNVVLQEITIAELTAGMIKFTYHFY